MFLRFKSNRLSDGWTNGQVDRQTGYGDRDSQKKRDRDRLLSVTCGAATSFLWQGGGKGRRGRKRRECLRRRQVFMEEVVVRILYRKQSGSVHTMSVLNKIRDSSHCPGFCPNEGFIRHQ